MNALEWIAPGFLAERDDQFSIAQFALRRLFGERPALRDAIHDRRAIVVAFAMSLKEEHPDLALDRRIADLIPRVDLSYGGITPLWVAGTVAPIAMKLRGLRYRPRKGYLLGTCGGGEGGVIFASNIDDTLLGSQDWQGAEAFVMRALDELLGPL